MVVHAQVHRAAIEAERAALAHDEQGGGLAAVSLAASLLASDEGREQPDVQVIGRGVQR